MYEKQKIWMQMRNLYHYKIKNKKTPHMTEEYFITYT